jgi:repressor LexA
MTNYAYNKDGRRKLSAREEQILTYIKKFIVSHGYSPSTREIGKGVGLSSPATIYVHLSKLIEAGYLDKAGSKFRTLKIVGDNEYENHDNETVKIPLLGKVTAGMPIEAIEQPDTYFSIPAAFIPRDKEIFSLKVWGESMINAGILDGDIVIVQRQQVARNGEIVVAMNENNEATVKTFYRENNHIRLQPENDHMDPIILSECTILGKVIGLYREIK